GTDIHFQQFRRNSPWNVEQLSKLSENLEELSQKKD
ncbi:NYN domain-containing protein, partial [Enterococcus faecalis]